MSVMKEHRELRSTLMDTSEICQMILHFMSSLVCSWDIAWESHHWGIIWSCLLACLGLFVQRDPKCDSYEASHWLSAHFGHLLFFFSMLLPVLGLFVILRTMGNRMMVLIAHSRRTQNVEPHAGWYMVLGVCHTDLILISVLVSECPCSLLDFSV